MPTLTVQNEAVGVTDGRRKTGDGSFWQGRGVMTGRLSPRSPVPRPLSVCPTGDRRPETGANSEVNTLREPSIPDLPSPVPGPAMNLVTRHAPMNIEALKREILERLRPLDPERVILFGSYAYGTPTEDSDIDLYVVTKDDFIPATYQEKRELVRKVSRALWDLRLEYPIDLIVHTRKMSELFFQKGGSFAREIREKGIVWHG